MNSFKQLLVAGALAVAGITAAHADAVVRGDYIPMDSGLPGVFINTWTISSDDLGPPKFTVAGYDGSIDYFKINVTDNEYVRFTASGDSADFYGYELLIPADGTLLASVEGDWGNSFSSGVFYLTTGVYELDLYNADDSLGNYKFQAIGSPIPEPGSMALMLAGLGAMGALARRRSKQPN